MAEFRGLRSEMPGDALVEPALDLGSEIENFDGHGSRPSNSRGLRSTRPDASRDASIGVLSMDIAYLADRFQYLSFNIL
jgi:hypothetical protein